MIKECGDAQELGIVCEIRLVNVQQAQKRGSAHSSELSNVFACASSESHDKCLSRHSLPVPAACDASWLTSQGNLVINTWSGQPVWRGRRNALAAAVEMLFYFPR